MNKSESTSLNDVKSSLHKIFLYNMKYQFLAVFTALVIHFRSS